MSEFFSKVGGGALSVMMRERADRLRSKAPTAEAVPAIADAATSATNKVRRAAGRRQMQASPGLAARTLLGGGSGGAY